MRGQFKCNFTLFTATCQAAGFWGDRLFCYCKEVLDARQPSGGFHSSTQPEGDRTVIIQI
ncbi:MAG: hypothetical protein AB4352_05830 [Hormoscilla sp.]